MSFSIVFRDEAQDEFDGAVIWYEERRAGLGFKFVEEIQAALEKIGSSPYQFQIVYKDIRRLVVRRFPYCIYYKIEVDRVIVLAIFHAKRDPQRWRT